MGRVYKNGQRVRIIAKYGGEPTGTIVKWVKNLDTYNIKGDDGYNYNCVDAEEMEVLEETPAVNEVKKTVEKFKRTAIPFNKEDYIVAEGAELTETPTFKEPLPS